MFSKRERRENTNIVRALWKCRDWRSYGKPDGQHHDPVKHFQVHIKCCPQVYHNRLDNSSASPWTWENNSSVLRRGSSRVTHITTRPYSYWYINFRKKEKERRVSLRDKEVFINSGMSVQSKPEWVFNKNRNHCSLNSGIGVQSHRNTQAGSIDD